MKKITIRRGSTSWLATFHGDEKIRDLFGTDTLPLPFTLEASGNVVRSDIQRRNPLAIIKVIDLEG